MVRSHECGIGTVQSIKQHYPTATLLNFSNTMSTFFHRCVLVLCLTLFNCDSVAPQKRHNAAIPQIYATVWNMTQVPPLSYEEQCLVYALQGLVNRHQNTSATVNAAPINPLFFDTGALNFDYPGSDRSWMQYLSSQRHVVFDSTSVAPTICALVSHYLHDIDGVVLYNTSSNYSVFLALTVSGVENLLPVSTDILQKYPQCFRYIPVKERIPEFSTSKSCIYYHFRICAMLYLEVVNGK